jgi:addiction module RelE/StbE family toxin
MVEVKWTRQAIDDVESIAEFIAKDSEKYAQIQVERIFERFEILETQPLMGRMVPEIENQNIRELILGNYRLIYRIVNEARVDVIGIYNSNRLISGVPSFKKIS